MSKELLVVGKSLPRKDAPIQVKGEMKFVTDIYLPRMLCVKFLRSPHAHANIIRIDTSRAEALPGVEAVLTRENVPRIHPMGYRRGEEKFEYLLDETVHYAGEEVAVIAAETERIANEALKLITVEYEVLPAVFDKEEAMMPDAPLVHPELGSNIYQRPWLRANEGIFSIQDGDVDKGFSEADYIVEGTYEAPWQHPVSPESRAIICQWFGDELTCWVTAQLIRKTQQTLADAFGIPDSKVRVIASTSVGGYGAKNPDKTSILVALAAKKTNRPAKATFTREEDFIATHIRADAKVYSRVGVKKDGSITALYNRMISTYGRDSTMSAFAIIIPAGDNFFSCYEWQNYKWEGLQVITNIEDTGAMNGFGDPSSAFCLERLMDEAAEKIGMDPVEFRLKNCKRAGSRSIAFYSIMYGPIAPGVLGPDLASFPKCIRSVAEKAHWKEKWKGWKTPVEVRGPKRRGIGIGIGVHCCMGQVVDSALVKLEQDGTAAVYSGAPEMGQGLRTAMAQTVAEVLGIKYEDVRVVLADTGVTPPSVGVFASRGVLACVGTAYRAAQDAMQKLFEVVAPGLEAEAKDLEVGEGRIFVKSQPNKGIPITKAFQDAYLIVGSSVLPYPWKDERTGETIVPLSAVATIAEVEVDTGTGELTVLSLTSAHDCGRVINPQIVKGQVHMALTMGTGWVTTEDFIIDKSTGVMLNPNLLDYKLMTMLDMPKMDDIREILVEEPTPWGPFGAKGMSETGSVAVAPAIANAVYNAIGVRIKGDHLTPNRILETLTLGKVSAPIR